MKRLKELYSVLPSSYRLHESIEDVETCIESYKERPYFVRLALDGRVYPHKDNAEKIYNMIINTNRYGSSYEYEEDGEGNRYISVFFQERASFSLFIQEIASIYILKTYHDLIDDWGKDSLDEKE